MAVKEAHPEPQVFSLHPLQGHLIQRRILAKALENQTLPGAYGFTGVAGIGKAHAAFLLVALRFCEAANHAPFLPCGQCGACQKLLHGHHPDLIWIKPEGKRLKIETFREVQKQLRYPPFFGRGRFIVIEDAHELTDAAQNALLKTLEAPPPDNHFIFISDQPWRLLATIRSRLQLLKFSPLSLEDMQAVLRSIGREEGIEPAVLRGALGSIGQAIRMNEAQWREERGAFQRGFWHFFQGKEEEKIWQALILGKFMHEKKAALEPALDVIQGFLRDLFLLTLHLDRETELIHEDFWRELRLKDPRFAIKISPDKVFELYRQFERFSRQQSFNANIELGVNCALLGV